EDLLNSAVIETIRRLVSNPKFIDLMEQKIDTKVDTTEIDNEISNYNKQLKHINGLKDRLLDEIDGLDWEDKHYERRKTDLEARLNKAYDKIEYLEYVLEKALTRRDAIEKDKITRQHIFAILINFEDLYNKMNDEERRQFLEALISEVQIYPERQANGQWLKSINFRLPLPDVDTQESLDNDSHVETVVLMSRIQD
nr:hypothetical protein [Clostridia bacterium]